MVEVENGYLTVKLKNFELKIHKSGSVEAKGRYKGKVSGLYEGILAFLKEVRIKKMKKGKMGEFLFDVGTGRLSVKLKEKLKLYGRGFNLGFEDGKCYLGTRNAKVWEKIGLEGVENAIEEVLRVHKITVPAEKLKYEVEGDRLLVLCDGVGVVMEASPTGNKVFYKFLYADWVDYGAVAKWVRNIFDASIKEADVKLTDNLLAFRVGYMVFVYSPRSDNFSWHYVSPGLFIGYDVAQDGKLGIMIRKRGKVFLWQELDMRLHEEEFKEQKEKMKRLYKLLTF